MKPALLLAITLLLCGCDTASAELDELFPRPVMEAPRGIPIKPDPQETAALDARAAREREGLPTIPPIADPQTYSNLGTVPPRPVLPTQEQIAAQVGGLAAEEQAGEAQVAKQADADEPATLPKARTKPGKDSVSATPPATPISRAPVPIIPVPQDPFLSGAAPLEGDESQVFSADNQAFLPQSQAIEQTDRHPELQP